MAHCLAHHVVARSSLAAAADRELKEPARRRTAKAVTLPSPLEVARPSQPVSGGIAVSAEGVTALDGIANVALRRSAPQPALAAGSAPAAALGSSDASGVHAQTSPACSPAGVLAEEPSLEDGTVPHVARQPSQPVSQGDEASAELDSGAAAIMGRQKSSTARQTQPVLTAQPQRSSW